MVFITIGYWVFIHGKNMFLGEAGLGNHLALGRWNVEMLASISFAFILPGGQ